MPIIITANPKITPDIGNRVFALLEFLSIMDVTHDSASIDLSLSLPLSFSLSLPSLLLSRLGTAFPRLPSNRPRIPFAEEAEEERFSSWAN